MYVGEEVYRITTCFVVQQFHESGKIVGMYAIIDQSIDLIVGG